MSKPPAYLNYAKDWLVDTEHLTLEEQGAYKRLMDHQWLNAPLPEAENDLARLVGVSVKRFRRIWGRIQKFFPPVPGGYANPRLEVERAKQIAYRAQQRLKGKHGAAARWDGHGHSNGHTEEMAPAKPMPQPDDGIAVSSFQRTTKAATPRATRGRPNWVTDAGRDLMDAWEGVAHYGKIGKHLAPLVDRHGWEAVRLRWRNYLQSVDPEFGSPARFAETYGKWEESGGRPHRDPSAPVSKVVAQEMFRRAGLEPPEKMPEAFTNAAAVERAIENHRKRGAA